jgi:thiol-disulfide isomerase/thioredoxin
VRIPLRRRLAFLVLGCLLAGLLALGLFGPWGSSGASVKLPNSLPSLDGGAPVALPKLGADRSAPVVITFFASWCSPCESELPAIARYAKAEQSKGADVEFIGIDENDTKGLAFVKKSGVGFPVGSDPYGNVLEDLGAEAALPQTIFIDTSGQIIHHVFGSVTSGTTLQTWVGKLTQG